jgi:hypothetical protein
MKFNFPSLKVMPPVGKAAEHATWLTARPGRANRRQPVAGGRSFCAIAAASIRWATPSFPRMCETWTPRPERAAAEFVRVLAPGGAVALSTWDVPQRARLIGVFLDAANDAGAVPLPHLPAGPSFFRFADDAEFTRLLRDAGLSEVGVRTVEFTHHVRGADELWDGMAGATVRTRALVFDQPADVKARIRAAYDRIVRRYAAPGGGLDLPVSVKVAVGTWTPPV